MGIDVNFDSWESSDSETQRRKDVMNLLECGRASPIGHRRGESQEIQARLDREDNEISWLTMRNV